MRKVWRFTGPPENWITAFTKNSWALNENNKNIWEHLTPDDVILFHSTRKSDYSNTSPSSIIGFGYVGNYKYQKKTLWWMEEIRKDQNIWPYVVPIKEYYLFSDAEKIDLETPIQDKTEETIKRELEILTESAVPIAYLNQKAQESSPDLPNFPVNGSASGVNEFYEDFLLRDKADVYLGRIDQDADEYNERIADTLDEMLGKIDESILIRDAQSYKDEGDGYTYKTSTRKVRRESQVQKRRVAILENYTCQICGFRCEYERSNGKKGWIIEVDHIVEKSDGGGEEMDNLWVLCPNCHKKKTRGVITINHKTKEVKEDGKIVEINDNHFNL